MSCRSDFARMGVARRFGMLLLSAAAVIACDGVASAAGEDLIVQTHIRVLQLPSEADGENGRMRAAVLEELQRLPAKPGDEVQAAVASAEQARRAVDAARIRLLAPRMHLPPGEEYRLDLGRMIERERMQPTDEPGVFRLVHDEPKYEGISFEIVVEPREDGSVDITRLEMNLHQMVGREKVEGISLEVGAPIIESRKATHAFTLKPGQQAVLLTDSLDRSGEAIVVLIETLVVKDVDE